jgi:hypothetical protein
MASATGSAAGIQPPCGGKTFKAMNGKQRDAISFVYIAQRRSRERIEAMPRIGIATGALLIALTAASGAAEAQHWSDPNFVAPANVTVHRGGNPAVMTGRSAHGSGDRMRHDRHRGRFGDGGFGGGWAWYDSDLNRSWDSDSYNDWWHDRPDRAYPRWVQRNEGCDEGRMWQGGGVWRCSW